VVASTPTRAVEIRLGKQHGEHVLRGVLGYSESEVGHLRESGVLHSDNR
jgi:hypothetical protein